MRSQLSVSPADWLSFSPVEKREASTNTAASYMHAEKDWYQMYKAALLQGNRAV